MELLVGRNVLQISSKLRSVATRGVNNYGDKYLEAEDGENARVRLRFVNDLNY